MLGTTTLATACGACACCNPLLHEVRTGDCHGGWPITRSELQGLGTSVVGGETGPTRDVDSKILTRPTGRQARPLEK